jgi:elongator complex protein 2
MDKTLIIWQPQSAGGVWMEKVRVGEVGGSNLGFLGGLFGPDGESIVAHGFQGAFHMWQYDTMSKSWLSAVTCGGHFGPVHDLAWGLNSEFLLSVSSDQTTRLHAEWMSADVDGSEAVWHEIARPQIHGYDMQCIALIDRFSFVSGADEKILRVFHAPRNFLENFHRISGTDVSDALQKMEGLQLAEGASVPALGLSNKAVYAGVTVMTTDADAPTARNKSNDQYSETYFTAQSLKAPPSEENLLQNTLWPEVQKLYGHGNEVYAVACCPDGTLLASACKATKPDHAAIIVWDMSTWRPVCRLLSHSLTITRLAFSHDGRLLLAVSRDRMWSLFRRRRLNSNPEDVPLFERVAFTDKKTSVHTRIIWSCAWSHDDRFFVTVSRDKKAIVWCPPEVPPNDSSTGQQTNWKAFSTSLDLAESITAVDFSPIGLDNHRYLLAFGVESGLIHFYFWSSQIPQTSNCWQVISVLSHSCAHHLTVRCIKFGLKQLAASNVPKLMVASCGDDNAVKIHDIFLDRI